MRMLDKQYLNEHNDNQWQQQPHKKIDSLMGFVNSKKFRIDSEQQGISVELNPTFDSKNHDSQALSVNTEQMINEEQKIFRLNNKTYSLGIPFILRIFFANISYVMYLIWKNVLRKGKVMELHHLPGLENNQKAENKSSLLEEALLRILQGKQISKKHVYNMVVYVFRKDFYVAHFLIASSLALKSLNSVVIQKIINTYSIHTPENAIWYVLLLMLLIFIDICLSNKSFIVVKKMSGKTQEELNNQFFMTKQKLQISIPSEREMFFFYFVFTAEIRLNLITCLYKKTSQLTSFQLKQANTSKLLNLLSFDFSVLEMMLYYGIFIIYIPLLLVIAAIVLYFRFGVYGLIPIFILVLNIPIQLAIGLGQKKYLNQKNVYSDKRIKLISETVDGVRLMKMYGWETAFEKLIGDVKDRELKYIRVIQLFRSSDRAFSLSFLLIAAFMLVLIMLIVEPDQLNSSKIYATLEQLYELRSALFLTGAGFSFIFQISLILGRFVEFLCVQKKPITQLELNAKYDPTLAKKQLELKKKGALLAEEARLNSLKNQKTHDQLKFVLPAEDLKTLDIPNLKYTQKKVEIQEPLNEQNIVELKDFSSFWDAEGYPTLKNISLEIKQGKQYSIVGKICSGKTTFLHTLLEEIPHFTGEFRKKGSFSFVEQEPYIFDGKLKDNILFGKPFEKEFYLQVLKSCCLLDDLDQLPDRDETEIGEKGVNLSGGQKARISLARAVYSRNDTYLLDDPLCAVDANVATRLYHQCLNGLLKGKTVIFVTHQIHFTKGSDQIFILDEGRVSHRGKYEELQEVLFELGNQQTIGDRTQRQSVILAHDEKEIMRKNTVIEDTNNEQKIHIQKGILFTQEKDEKFNLSLKTTYKQYFTFSKIKLTMGVVLCLYAASEVLDTGIYYLFGSYDTSEDRWKLIWQIGILIGCFMLACFAKYFGTILITTEINSNIHRKMVHATVHSPVLYFDQTPSGRILTKFSNDIGSVDLMLPLALIDCLEGPMQFLNICITVGVINPWFFLLAVILVLCSSYFLKKCQKLLVQSKQLDMIYKAPVLSFFSKTIQGAIHIRIYGQLTNFTKEMFAKANDSLRTNITLWFFNRTFSYNQQVITLFFSTGGIILALFTSKNEFQLGQTIVYLSMLVDVVYALSRSIPNLHSHMTCTERILQICNLPSEDSFVLPSDLKPETSSTVILSDLSRKKKKHTISKNKKYRTQEIQGWIKYGSINFQDVKMKYKNDQDLVLKGTSFTIEGTQRVGCVGRTGAGKSSLIQALFRMTGLEPGGSITIDGVEIQKIDLHTLRSSISIIPQTSFIFSGSIRRNLDPFDEYSDIAIWKSLEKTNLDQFISKLPDRLLTNMSNSDNIFSAGQKQLICLARVILKNSKILILDEATANMDMKTDEFIQQIIKEQFTESTIFTIAHRLNTIADYDKVIVMDNGVAVEFDQPYLLLVKAIGDTTITSPSVFATMVQNTGKDNAQNIFEIAERQYSMKQQKQQI